MTKQKIIAVIPALNEEKTISKVINGVKEYVDEIVLVDDASTDKTKTLAENGGAIVISHSKTLGYDKALNDGFSLASKRGATIILTFDGDGQHNPEDIPKIISPLMDGKADIVVGKRPRHARITEFLFAFIAKIKIGINDPLCGIKAYKIEVYEDIGYFDKISSIGTHLMFDAKKKGYRIVQRNIKINKRYDDSRFGKKLKANWKIFKAIIQIILN